MILVKGERVFFAMASGRIVRCPPGNGLLHDPDGEIWPRCTTYIGPIRRTIVATATGGKAKAYFGRNYEGKAVTFSSPPATGWREVGLAVQIDYSRRGKYAGPYFHPFKRGVHPTLFRSGKWLKLELGNGCIYDDRGFVFP